MCTLAWQGISLFCLSKPDRRWAVAVADVRRVWERVQEAKFKSEAEFKSFLDDNDIEMPAEEMADCFWPEEV